MSWVQSIVAIVPAMKRSGIRVALFGILTLAIVPFHAQSQENSEYLSKLERAVPLLEKLTNITCRNLPLSGDWLKLGGDAKVEFNNLLKKLGADLELGGEAVWERFNNVPREQLAESIKNEVDCRQEVFRIMHERLFPSPPAEPEPTDGTLDIDSIPPNMRATINPTPEIELPTRTPISVRLPFGTYTVRLTKLDAEHEGWGYWAKESFKIEPGKVVASTIEAQRVELARLTINPLNSNATYYLNDSAHSLGRLTQPTSIYVFPGEHTLSKDVAGSISSRIFSIDTAQDKTVSF